MMFSTESAYRNRCSLLSILCRKVSYDDDDKKKQLVADDQHKFLLPELTSSGRLEVNVVSDTDPQGFRRTLEALEPHFLHLQGFQHEDSEEIGPLVWKNVELSAPEALCSLFSSKLPTTVYLEIPDGEELAEALHSKGIPYVIYWKGAASRYAAAHFRQALLSVVQSSCSHTWDTFQLAQASYRLYCAHNDNVALSPDCENPSSSLSGPQLLGDPPTIEIVQPEADAEGEEDSPENLSSVKIYDDDVSLRFLVCGMAHTLDGRFLRSLEDGVNALLRIEIRGSKLHNRVSAPPPPLQAGTFSRGVVTMRCDFSTCTAAHISLLVSGNAQTCFNDQLLENHVKNELIENNRPAHALPSCEESNPSSFEPRKSAAIACGASVFEVCMKLPAWASQIIKQLAPDVSYRSLVMLGIGSIQGVPVASFEKDDAERLLFLSARQGGGGIHDSDNVISTTPPIWLKPPPPSRRKMSEPCQDSKPSTSSMSQNGSSKKRRLNSAAMRPIPHVGPHRMLLPFKRLSEIERHEAGPVKANHSTVSVKQNASATPPVLHRKSSNSSSLQAQQIIALNPLPLKKHGCDRAPIQSCSEEEFLRDVMEFLILRGHSRLVPQGGLPEFPDAVLNTKRLDLFNLYREVVTRGGFNVGNGINWKGQVFSKMRNYTLTNRMTGVGNTLKRHYETYLLEYELAHDDVGGECCLLCHSSAAGDWVNCGICGEWAHFGCDRRQGLGAFKDYAKTDGLEYICPHCSMSNFRKKSQKTSNGY